MRQALRALKSGNYRLFFFGQAVSLIGSWMESVALQWFVLTTTGRTDLLGIVAFTTLVPGFLLGPFAGVLVDRFDKRKLLLVTQFVLMVQASVLAALVFTKAIEVWMIISLSVVAGLASAFDMPARQALMVHLVEDREDLASAIALNSSQFNLARLIGPALAGFAYVRFGPAWCFTINAASFLAVLLALFKLKVKDTSNREARGNILESILEGASYVSNMVPVRALILLLAAVSFLAGAQSVMMPVLAERGYHGNATTLGYIQSAIGVGALIASIVLASRRSVLGLGKWIVVAVSVYGTALIAVAFVRWIPLGLVALTFVGAGVIAHMAATNTLVQTVIDDKMRGRVMAFYTMAFTGTMPFGSLLAGYAADSLDKRGISGVTVVLASTGALCLLAALFFLRSLPKLKAAIRPVYIEKGILTA